MVAFFPTSRFNLAVPGDLNASKIREKIDCVTIVTSEKHKRVWNGLMDGSYEEILRALIRPSNRLGNKRMLAY